MLIDTREAARRLGISYRTLRDQARRGVAPVRPIRHTPTSPYLWHPDAIAEHLRQSTKAQDT